MNVTPTFRAVLWIRGDIYMKHPAPCLAGDRKALTRGNLLFLTLFLTVFRKIIFRTLPFYKVKNIPVIMLPNKFQRKEVEREIFSDLAEHNLMCHQAGRCLDISGVRLGREAVFFPDEHSKERKRSD